MNHKALTIHIIVLLLLPLIATFIVWNLKLPYFFSILFFYGLPILWIVFRKQEYAIKLLLFSLLVSIPYALILDIIGMVNNSWVVPYSIFNTRLIGIPYEDFLWLFLSIFMILCLFKYFAKEKTAPYLLNKVFIFFLSIVCTIAVTIIYLRVVNPNIIRIPYPYVTIGLSLIVPMIGVLLLMKDRAGILKKSLGVAAYFFFVTFLFELIGINLHHWEFTGQYLGKIPIPGGFIPLEELATVLIGGAFITITYYYFTVEYYSKK